MATLEILEILGIRSFGPLEPQKLQFISPVTLIHGPNGTGKTTVIECLRYATTGDQPPNTKGGAFLFDPKLCDESSIKAQVKLQFKCVTGEQTLVSRSQQATRKAKSVTVKTVDTALKRKLKNGETVVLDSRCADINVEMKHALGVSAPILQNVIFCHQEESNWPLSEGKALKEKFDDIFASTRYVKALANITKIRKEKGSELKVQQATLDTARVHKETAAKIVAKRKNAELELERVTEMCERVEDELLPVDKKLNMIRSELQNINTITFDLVKKKHTHELLIKDAEDIKQGLKGNLFNGSTAGLEQALEDFESEMSQKGAAVAEFQAKIDHVDKSIKKLVDAEKHLLGNLGQFQQLQQRNAANITKRDETVKKLVRDYELSGLKAKSVDLSQGHLEKFNRSIKEKEADIAEMITQEKAAFDLQDQELQKNLDDRRERKSQLETTCQMKKERISSNKHKARTLTQKLGEVAASSGKLDNIILDLSRRECELTEVQESMDTSAANAEIKKLQDQRVELDLKLRQIKEELSKANSQTKERTSLDMLKDSMKEKQEQINRLKSTIEDTVVENLGEFPAHNLKYRMDDAAQVIAGEIKEANDKINKLKMELHSLEMKRATTREKMSGVESSVKEIKDKIGAVCDITKFDETLGDLADEIAAEQDNRGLLHGVKEMFARYHRMLTDASRPKHEQKCPLCKRPFSEEEEVDELATELDRHVQGLPARMENSEQKLERLTSRQETLQHLVPQREQLHKLEKELPALRTTIFDLGKDIDGKKAAISKLEGDTAMRQDDEESLKSVLQDVYKMDQLQSDVSRLDEKVKEQEMKLNMLDSTRSVQEISDEQDELQMKYDTTTMNVEHQQKKVNAFNDNVQKLRSKVNDLKADKLRIQQGVQEKCKLEEQKAALLEENSKLQLDIEGLLDELRPFGRVIQTILTDKRDVLNRKEARLDELTKQQQQLTSKMTELNKIQADIDRYVSEKRAEELTKTSEDLEKLREKTRECEEVKRGHVTEMEAIKKELAEQKIRERELKDNLRYRAKLEEADGCAKQVEEINEKLGGLDATRLDIQQRELEQRQEELKKEKATATERMRNWKEQLNSLTAELDNKELRDAHDVYMKRSIALQVNKLVVTDLDKYHKALDRAIMEYHQNKMADLNRIIRNLWKETYRGHDIDYIEICSDDAASSHDGDVEAVDISKRKTYNYRVVMFRNGIQMDMRGRCSAGQKVLASLIIRLALAETFCLSCGILALDEPTTNLDVENIESLAHALSDIIRTRQNQRNFQLIIITHDTQFVEILGRRIGVEHFYKIGKNVRGQSELKRSSIDEIVY